MSDTATKELNGETHKAARKSVTIEGVHFDATQNIWRIPSAQATAVFDFNNLPGVSDKLRGLFKSAFESLLLSSAPERLTLLLGRLRSILANMLEFDPCRIINEFTAADIKNYSASLPNHRQYFLRQAKEILVAWAKTGVVGLSHDLLLLLPSLETKCHEVGLAVRTMDPEAGPLTDIEYEAVVAAIHKSYATGHMSLADYGLVILGITLGARSMQLAMIKAKDLTVAIRSDGSKVYILQITRLKQGKNIRPRTLFRARQLSSDVGSLVEQQAISARAWAKTHKVEEEEAPLFPSTRTAPQERRVVLSNLKGHYNGRSMAGKISKILKRLNVYSSRTGNPMSLFQTRLRRTLGSRAAAEGLSAPLIADLMDHTWVDSSLVYIETRPEMIDRIDKALALHIAPLAQAFAGTLVEKTPQDSVAPMRKLIHVSTSEALQPVGACGKFDFCGLAAPLACYTCSYFNPWLDDIHEDLLDSLLKEREELLEQADHRIASVNDRTILAIADVVNRCRTKGHGV